MGLELIVMRDTSLEPNSFAITAEISSLGNPQRLLSLCEVAGIFRKSRRALQQQIYDGGIVRGEVPPPIKTDSRNIAWVPLVVDIFLREKARAAMLEYAAADAADNVSKETLIGPWLGTVPGAVASGLKGMLAALSILVTALAEMMIITGLMMEIVLPMMQYMMWMAAIAGLMVFAVEAVVGASFWAFSHVRADGQDLINQQQSYGYSILTNAIFRPLLTVVGLVFSSVIMAVMAQFVDETFALAFSNSGVGGLYDPFAIVALFLLLFYIHYQVAVRALRTITLLPDAILKWIGSGVSASSYGELMGEEHGNNYMGLFMRHSSGNIRSAGRAGVNAATAGGKGGSDQPAPNPDAPKEDANPE
jgi:hypothetical protein